MSNNLNLKITLTADGKQLSGSLKTAGGQVHDFGVSAQRAGDTATTSFSKTRQGVESISTQLQKAQARLISFVAAQTAISGVGSIIKAADDYGQMAERIKLVTSSTAEYSLVQERLLAVSVATDRQLAEAQELYIQTADALSSLGYTTEQALDVTDSLSYAFDLNAASSERAASATNAFSRSLQTGKVSALDWQSILLATPSIVETLAQTTGKTTNQIRALGVQGKLSLTDLTEALRLTKDENQQLAATMDTTVEQAFTRLSTKLSVFIGETNQSFQVTQKLAGGIAYLAENLDMVAKVIQTGIIVAAGRYIGLAVTAAATTLRAGAAHLAASKDAATHAGTLNILAAAKTRAATAGKGLLALLGGPAGLVITAAAVAASFVDWGNSAKTAASDIDTLTASTDGLSAAAIRLRRIELVEALEKQEQAAAKASMRYQDMQRQLDIGLVRSESFRKKTAQLAVEHEEASGKVDQLRAALQRLDETTRQMADAPALKIGEQANEAAGEIETIIERLQQQHMQLALNEEQYLRYQLGVAGASEEHIKQALAIHQATAKLKEYNANQAKATPVVSKLDSAFSSLYDSLFPAEAAQRKYNEQLAVLQKHLKGGRLADAIERLNDAFGVDHSSHVETHKEYLKEINDELDELRDRFDPLRVKNRQWTAEVKLLDAALRESQITAEEYRLMLGQLGDEYVEATRATTEWTRWTESALDRVDSAFADAWRNIGDGFSSFRNNLTSAFKQMLAELAHLAITRPIVMQIGAALGIGGMSGSAMAGGLLGGGGGELGGTGGSSGGGGLGLGSLWQAFSMGKTAYQAATGQGLVGSIMSGWGSGGFSGALGGAQAWGTGALAGVNQSLGQIYGVLTQGGGMTYAPLTYQMGGLANTISGLGPALSGFTGALMGYQQAGIKGAAAGGLGGWGGAKLGGMAGAYIGSVVPVIGTAIGGAVGTVLGGVLGSIGGSKIFGKGGEKYKRTYGRVSGFYDAEDGYTGKVELSQFGYEQASSLQDINKRFQESLVGIHEIFGESVDVFSRINTRLRRTSGALVGDFHVIMDDMDGLWMRQYAGKGDVAGGMEQLAENILGEYLAAMLSESKKLPEYFRDQIRGITESDVLAETLADIFGRFEGVNAALELTGHALYELTNEGMKASDQLLELAGGLENLQAASSIYYDNFFTDLEKQEHAIKSITEAFEDAEVALPATRDKFRAMVEDIDTTTESGREMYATLMLLSGQAAQYFDIAEQRAAQAVAEAMGEANNTFSLLQRSISAERSRLTREFNLAVQAEQEAARRASEAAQASANARIESLSSALSASNELARVLQNLDRVMSNALDRLRSTEADAVALRRSQSVTLLQDALAQARAGKSLAGIEGLEGAIGVAATLDTATYRTFEDFQREQGRTANLIADLQKLNGKQLTAEERILESLEQQLDAAREHASSITSGLNGISDKLQAEYDAAMAGLDSQLAAAQAQMDALNGVDNSILSVDESVNRMSVAVVAAINAQTELATTGQMEGKLQDNEATIKRLYESIVGYEADKEGVRFWSEHFAGGGTYFDLIDALVASAHAAALPKVPGFASGGLHAGGLRLVGENGPELEVTGPSRIYSASQTANMLAGDSQRTVAAIEKLERTISAQSDALRSIAKHTHRTAQRVEMLERWDYDGMPESREAM